MRLYIICCFCFLLASCGEHAVDLTGNTALKAETFYGLFTPLKGSKKYSDTGLMRAGDTLQISLKLLNQYVPDSVTTKAVGKKPDQVKLFPLGFIGQEKKEKYLLVKYVRKKDVALWVYVLGADNNYKTGMKLLSNDAKDKYTRDITITPEPTFISNREKITADNTFYTKNAMAFNAADNTFINVMRDSNEDADENIVLNPIDTLPQQYKYSGNYTRDKKNFISVRDGKNDSTYQFFLHIDKNNGNCSGELKSVFVINKKGEAIYKEGGDPCVINFTFSANSVVMLEAGSCGNRRGMECLFDETFKKQKANIFKEKK